MRKFLLLLLIFSFSLSLDPSDPVERCAFVASDEFRAVCLEDLTRAGVTIGKFNSCITYGKLLTLEFLLHGFPKELAVDAAVACTGICILPSVSSEEIFNECIEANLKKKRK